VVYKVVPSIEIVVREIKFLLETYQVDGETIVPVETGICYKINVLEVKKQDTLENDYVPQPFIHRALNFTVTPSQCIRYVEQEWSPWIILTRPTKLYSPDWKRALPPHHSGSSRRSGCLLGHYFRARERHQVEAQEDIPFTQTRFQSFVCFGRGEADSSDLCE